MVHPHLATKESRCRLLCHTPGASSTFAAGVRSILLSVHSWTARFAPIIDTPPPPIDWRVHAVVGPLLFACLFPLSYTSDLFESKNFATASEDKCPQSVVTVYSR